MSCAFVWYELLTTEPEAAAYFYGGVIGWAVEGFGQPGSDYRILSKDGVGVGGLMKLPPGAIESGMRPAWLAYISVDDVDVTIERIVAAGGRQFMPATDIAGVGRLAMISDPQGAPFYVIAPIGDGPATSFAPGKAGHGGWHELRTSDRMAALEFYEAQFGWHKVHEMDMGAAGTYVQFNFGDGKMAGGMMDDPSAPCPYWTIVFGVDDIDAACERVQAGGGEVLTGPHEVPTGDWVIRARDPQGVTFALVGRRA